MKNSTFEDKMAICGAIICLVVSLFCGEWLLFYSHAHPPQSNITTSNKTLNNSNINNKADF